MAVDLTKWHADKKARLARGEAKSLVAVEVPKDTFVDTVQALAHETDEVLEVHAAPVVKPQAPAAPATWSPARRKTSE